jgi:hypothetical protein
MVAMFLSIFTLKGLASAKDTVTFLAYEYSPHYSKVLIMGKGFGFITDIIKAAYATQGVDATITYGTNRSATSLKEILFVAPHGQ